MSTTPTTSRATTSSATTSSATTSKHSPRRERSTRAVADRLASARASARLPAALAALAAAALGLAAVAQAPAPAPVETTHGTRAEPPAPTAAIEPEDGADVEFLRDALRASLDAARLGGLARDRTANPAVRALGARLADDHTKIAGEIREMLGTLNVTLTEEQQASAEASAADLEKLSGAELDRAFLARTIESHETAVTRYEARAEANPDAELAVWAARALPMLEKHLASARDLLARASGRPSG